MLKGARVPSFCNSRWYFALFMPAHFGEYLAFLAAVLICFLAIPYGIYMLIPGRQPLYLAGIYFAVIVVFGGIYILLTNRTKARHLEDASGRQGDAGPYPLQPQKDPRD